MKTLPQNIYRHVKPLLVNFRVLKLHAKKEEEEEEEEEKEAKRMCFLNTYVGVCDCKGWFLIFLVFVFFAVFLI
jgi:hypothetical protein